VNVDRIVPYEPGADWIDDLTDDQCLEVFWLYVDDPPAFFEKHPKALLGQALRYALRTVIANQPSAVPNC
jgi:hypothetical protein